MGLLPLLLRTRPPCGGCSADTAPSTQVLHLTLLYRGRGLPSDIGEHSLLLQQWNGLVNLRLIGSRHKNAEDAWPAAATASATTMASLLYASPAWWGYTSANDRVRIDRLINRLRRGG